MIAPRRAALTALLLLGCSQHAAAPSPAERLVVVGGALTELVFALEAGHLVVGTDTSSVYPDATAALPKVGYQRTVSAEGVLALAPTRVLCAPEAGPPAALQQIRAAGVEVEVLTEVQTVSDAVERIRRVAAILGRPEAAKPLVDALESEVASTRAALHAAKASPRALFVYARGVGQAFVAGAGTPAANALALAGATPAISEFEGFRPLTSEAVVGAAPDVIIAPARALQALGGRDALLALPGMSDTPAAKTGRIVEVDELELLGYGPRFGQGLQKLARAFHPELSQGAP